MGFFYKTLHLVVAFSLDNYFSSIDIQGEKPVENGPLIIVSNHPNYLLDPLLIASRYKRPLWFLSKAVIFNTITTPLLYALHAIPIYRRMDDPGLMHKNEQSFVAATERLTKDGAILIFPEGLSINQRSSLDIKSGAARIAHLAQQQLGVKDLLIQPIGLTYAGFHRNRSAVTITFGTPINSRHFIETFNSQEKKENKIKVVQALTQEIKDRLTLLTSEIEEADHAKLIEKIATVYSSLNTHNNYLERFNIVKANLLLLGDELHLYRDTLEPKIDNFIRLLSSFGFADGTTLETPKRKLWHALLFPVHIVGYFVQLLPYSITKRILNNRIRDHKTGSLQFGYGVLIFWAWYLLILIGALVTLGNPVVAIGLFFVSLVTVYVYNRYRDHCRLALLDLLWPGQTNPLNLLRLLQSELIEELEALRKV